MKWYPSGTIPKVEQLEQKINALKQERSQKNDEYRAVKQKSDDLAKARQEIEAYLKNEREGIKIAKAQGKYNGRKPISIDWSKFEKRYTKWKSGTITAREFQRRMDLKANTFYRRVREYEETHSITADMGNPESEEENVPTAEPYQLSLLNEKQPVSGTETTQV